jgi:DNA-binding NarL/FixJ family response regulator
MKIRILLVDDHSFIRRALRISLADETCLEIVGEATNGQLAIEQVELLKPDVVLMDIQMPHLDGVEATKQICDRFPNRPVGKQK